MLEVLSARSWLGAHPSIDSIAGMKAALPTLKKKLYSDSAYFKKIYMHTFDMAKAPGARTLGLETGTCWGISWYRGTLVSLYCYV